MAMTGLLGSRGRTPSRAVLGSGVASRDPGLSLSGVGASTRPTSAVLLGIPASGPRTAGPPGNDQPQRPEPVDRDRSAAGCPAVEAGEQVAGRWPRSWCPGLGSQADDDLQQRATAECRVRPPFVAQQAGYRRP